MVGAQMGVSKGPSEEEMNERLLQMQKKEQYAKKTLL